MKGILLGIVSLSLMLLSSVCLADPPAGVRAHPGVHSQLPSAAVPPGLYQDMPHGLVKKNKTPRGWSRGHKKGWMKHHNRKMKY